MTALIDLQPFDHSDLLAGYKNMIVNSQYINNIRIISGNFNFYALVIKYLVCHCFHYVFTMSFTLACSKIRFVFYILCMVFNSVATVTVIRIAGMVFLNIGVPHI